MTTQAKTSETLRAFIERNRITATVVWTDRNPNMEDAVDGSRHYVVTLHATTPEAGRRQLAVPFTMGPALEKEPTAAEVLECLASDSSSIDNARGFEDWCGEFGYDTDSRKAERTYRACEHQSHRLWQLLGETEYDRLLWHTERE